ncbi:hypothetical protein EMIHUDRAFT_232076 [Emiliania huxleyi CCMP1516]|uniref:RAP domain-containing protein n=2 Tax=Emiliania huxleyi TaxID=2903 RepID=A0A0D3K6C0_EMIH1|nr:hypothetical protein EMIHUDRAFT_232076 [Emiliania huxleyi CCMP1516]EOD31305.1 hypothetical protein EMIHUDRAFT_232076 [Emiliania huxleyi CCMP1516]|eukprot:XP_005783734.1 hypothetical protein EMIHUDRAFT_232076 [Emiliania huxleyi CCMP1516]
MESSVAVWHNGKSSWSVVGRAGDRWGSGCQSAVLVAKALLGTKQPAQASKLRTTWTDGSGGSMSSMLRRRVGFSAILWAQITVDSADAGQTMSNSGFSPLVCLGTAATGLLLLAYQLQPAPAPQVQRAPAALGATAKARPSSMQSAATALPVGSPPPIGAAGLSASYRDHLSDSALAEPDTLARAVAASAADGEVMLLCVGGSGAMRTGLNLVLNFRAMGLYHMLVLALERDVCTSLWDALPSLACVWWPRRLEAPRPASLYNTMFNKVALAFFEARKVLLERLVVKHRLNVLHLDADTIWFANPYPVLKTVYRDHAIVVQADNPFANAGLLWAQRGAKYERLADSERSTRVRHSAWVLEELNRRIDRFTYRPESANLNDIIASSLNGAPTFAAGVEFYEARFKKDKGSQEAAKRMQDGRYRRASAAARQYYPTNPAPAASLLLAPEWLFSHFPYGIFFPAPNGPTLLKRRLLAAAGWRVISVPFFEWDALPTASERQTYLERAVALSE